MIGHLPDRWSAAIVGLPEPGRAPPARVGRGLDVALRTRWIGADRLRALLDRQVHRAGQSVYAIDGSIWSRCGAEMSVEHGYYDHPSRHLDGQPIVTGWSYQWVVQLSFSGDIWTAPADVRRVESGHPPHFLVPGGPIA